MSLQLSTYTREELNELSKDEIEALLDIYQLLLNSIGCKNFTFSTVEEIIGEIPNQEHYFLEKSITNNKIIEDLKDVVLALLEPQNFNPPDEIIMQIFNRKGGYFRKKSKWSYGIVFPITDFQVYTYNGEDHVIKERTFSQLFDFSVSIPSVKKQSRFKNILKKRQYRCIAFMMLWKTNPKN